MQKGTIKAIVLPVVFVLAVIIFSFMTNQTNKDLTTEMPVSTAFIPLKSHPVLEGKPNANHVRVRISNSRTQQLHNRTSSQSVEIIT